MNACSGRRSVFRARNAMAALSRSPVLPEATPVGPLSALSRHPPPGAPSVRFRSLVLRPRKPDDRLAVRLPASAQRRQPVCLRLSQPKKILTPPVALGGIDDAARRQGSLDGAVSAGGHGDANQS